MKPYGVLAIFAFVFVVAMNIGFLIDDPVTTTGGRIGACLCLGAIAMLARIDAKK